MKNYFALLFILLLTFSCKNDPADASTNKKSTTASTEKTEATNTNTKPANETTSLSTGIPNHYICFKDNDNPDNKMWISFSVDSKAIELKITGQSTPFQMMFESEQLRNEGANPTSDTFYYVVDNGKKRGRVKLTHSGNWDYVEYVQGRPVEKVFNFTIDHDADPYGKKACF